MTQPRGTWEIAPQDLNNQDSLTPESNILEIDSLTKHYPGFDLKDIHLTLPCGYVMGLIGENGAGKSTMLKALLGLINEDSGAIQIFGKDWKSCGQEIREQVGAVLGEVNLPDIFCGKEICRMMSGIYKNWNQDAFYGYLDTFHIDRKKKIKEYSRGMKVKAAIAIALSHDARLLILDEPTNGLDPVAREDVMEILRNYVMDESRAVLISSHILSDLEKIADYVAFLHDGQIMISGEKDQLMEEYKLLKGSRQEIFALAAGGKVTIERYCENEFGMEALVKNADSRQLGDGLVLEPADLEKIMLYSLKGVCYDGIAV